MDNPKVSIIILNWNGKSDTIECLESLKNITYTNYEVILVDNGSTDGSVEYLKKMYPGMEIIENQKNLGFAEGNNIAIRKVTERDTDYVLMLNNDTIVAPELITKLIEVLENDPTIGIAGPTVYSYYNRYNIQSAGGKICWYKGRTSHYKKRSEIKIDEIRDVDYIMGCALFTRSELFKKIGYLNKDYFAYWEETDWCVRAKKASYRVVYVPSTKIWHKGGSTTKKTNGFYEYHMTRNMFWFMKTHSTNTQHFLFILYFFGFRLWFLSAVHILYYKDLKVYGYFLKGILDGNKAN